MADAKQLAGSQTNLARLANANKLREQMKMLGQIATAYPYTKHLVWFIVPTPYHRHFNAAHHPRLRQTRSSLISPTASPRDSSVTQFSTVARREVLEDNGLFLLIFGLAT